MDLFLNWPSLFRLDVYAPLEMTESGPNVLTIVLILLFAAIAVTVSVVLIRRASRKKKAEERRKENGEKHSR